MLLPSASCAQQPSRDEAVRYLDTLPRSSEHFGGYPAPDRTVVDYAYNCEGEEFRLSLVLKNQNDPDRWGVEVAGLTTPWGAVAEADLVRMESEMASFRNAYQVSLTCDLGDRAQVIWIVGMGKEATSGEQHRIFWLRENRLERVQ
jgi:hypothetical protein